MLSYTVLYWLILQRKCAVSTLLSSKPYFYQNLAFTDTSLVLLFGGVTLYNYATSNQGTFSGTAVADVMGVVIATLMMDKTYLTMMIVLHRWVGLHYYF